MSRSTYSLSELRDLPGCARHETAPFRADFKGPRPRFVVGVPILDEEGWPVTKDCALVLEWWSYSVTHALKTWDFGRWIPEAMPEKVKKNTKVPPKLLKSGELNSQWVWWQYWIRNQTLGDIADVLGMSVGALQGRFQKWNFPRRSQGAGGRGNADRSKLTDDMIRDLKKRAAKRDKNGDPVESKTELGEKFQISRQRVHQIINGQHRRLTE